MTANDAHYSYKGVTHGKGKRSVLTRDFLLLHQHWQRELERANQHLSEAQAKQNPAAGSKLALPSSLGTPSRRGAGMQQMQKYLIRGFQFLVIRIGPGPCFRLIRVNADL